MIQITGDNISALNEKYKEYLSPNAWELKPNDVLFNKLNNSQGIGFTMANSQFPWITDDSTFWIDPTDLDGCKYFWLMNQGAPWKVKNIKLRVIPSKQFKVQQNADSAHGAIRLYLPQNFDLDFRCKQFPGLTKNPEIVNTRERFVFFVDGDGAVRHHLIDLHSDGDVTNFKFCGFACVGSGFTNFRLFQIARQKVVTGEISDFYTSGAHSENNYWGSIDSVHTKFKNVKIKNGLCVNAGTEWLQMLNLGEGCEISNMTLIQSATQWTSPFQNYQYAANDVKAGGGSFKISKIYMEMPGSSALTLYSSAATASQEGAKKGDVVQIEDLYISGTKGSLVYVNNSCNNGVKWILRNVTICGYNSQMVTDTQMKVPEGFLLDFGTMATDEVVIENLTVDKSLPLAGKGVAKYNIKEANIVDSVSSAKFIMPSFLHNEIVVAYHHKYNQTSQQQFYKVAGQVVKYKQSNIAYYDQKGKPRTWWRAITDVVASDSGPGSGWEQLFWDNKGVRSDFKGHDKSSASPICPDYFVQSLDSELLNKVGFEQSVTVPDNDNNIEELTNKITSLTNEINLTVDKIIKLYK